nr:NAD(P)-binding domain-containing protein [Allosalinactinospora lopnorensis]
MNVGILGSGDVARALGAGFHKYGHDVMLGSRAPAKLTAWSAEHPGARVGSFAEAAGHGEVVVLSVSGRAAEQALSAAGAENLNGKPVIDTTNPIADAPPDNGVLRYFTDLNESLMERLQERFPEALFVKAFNSVGNPHMVDPRFEGGTPTMFICGDNDGAKRTVRGILEQFGWEVADMGGAEGARAIEPLCMLWCIPLLLRGEGDHAFRLLKRAGGT